MQVSERQCGRIKSGQMRLHPVCLWVRTPCFGLTCRPLHGSGNEPEDPGRLLFSSHADFVNCCEERGETAADDKASYLSSRGREGHFVIKEKAMSRVRGIVLPPNLIGGGGCCAGGGAPFGDGGVVLAVPGR